MFLMAVMADVATWTLFDISEYGIVFVNILQKSNGFFGKMAGIEQTRKNLPLPVALGQCQHLFMANQAFNRSAEKDLNNGQTAILL